MTENCERCGKYMGAYCPKNARDRVILGCDDCRFGELMSQENFAEQYLYTVASNPFFDEREI